jgi:hypothetical protein
MGVRSGPTLSRHFQKLVRMPPQRIEPGARSFTTSTKSARQSSFSTSQQAATELSVVPRGSMNCM